MPLALDLMNIPSAHPGTACLVLEQRVWKEGRIVTCCCGSRWQAIRVGEAAAEWIETTQAWRQESE